MGLFDQEFSDYGSRSSLESTASWGDHHKIITKFPKMEKPKPLRPIKASSNNFVGMNRNSLEEFRMNGVDTSYEPDEDRSKPADSFVGLGPSNVYLRQKSWPEPERTPALRLPRPSDAWLPAEPTHRHSLSDIHIQEPPQSTPGLDIQDITPNQLRVINSLPNQVLYSLLKELEQERRKIKRQPEECRFCKNNGERESHYRSHQLKDAFGRVTCPVLRAFTCSRCGAHGDYAHTYTYCPYTSYEERRTSAARMRSMRMASGRRRVSAPPVSKDGNSLNTYDQYIETPLDPLWAALEQKLAI